jgi:hypothetical protein
VNRAALCSLTRRRSGRRAEAWDPESPDRFPRAPGLDREDRSHGREPRSLMARAAETPILSNLPQAAIALGGQPDGS